MKIDGKVAVVVGGARGIGRAYCEALLSKGAKVAMGDILDDLGKKTVSEFIAKYGSENAVFVCCDNTKDEDIKALFQCTLTTFGPPDIVVHNAATLHEFNWEKCLDVNVGGVVRCCNEALKYMSKANGGKGGVVVNTASVGGLGPVMWGPMYAATKFANVGYTISWGAAENVAITGVRFNCICPTAVDTEFQNLVSPDRVYHAEMTREACKNISMLKPEDVAEALIRLIEDDSLTGKALWLTERFGHRFPEFVDLSIQ